MSLALLQMLARQFTERWLNVGVVQPLMADASQGAGPKAGLGVGTAEDYRC